MRWLVVLEEEVEVDVFACVALVLDVDVAMSSQTGFSGLTVWCMGASSLSDAESSAYCWLCWESKLCDGKRPEYCEFRKRTIMAKKMNSASSASLRDEEKGEKSML